MASLLRRSGATVAHLLRHSQPRRMATVPPSRPLPTHSDVARHDSPVNWGFAVVPKKRAFVVERFGKYLKTLRPGIHLLVPVVDRIAYVHSLKEEVVPMEQFAVTKDKVPLGVNAAFSFKVIDPYLASYEVEDPIGAAIDLAETLLRGELEKISFDKTSEMKSELNDAILLKMDMNENGYE